VNTGLRAEERPNSEDSGTPSRPLLTGQAAGRSDAARASFAGGRPGEGHTLPPQHTCHTGSAGEVSVLPIHSLKGPRIPTARSRSSKNQKNPREDAGTLLQLGPNPSALYASEPATHQCRITTRWEMNVKNTALNSAGPLYLQHRYGSHNNGWQTRHRKPPCGRGGAGVSLNAAAALRTRCCWVCWPCKGKTVGGRT
jgi:hypothetical protein